MNKGKGIKELKRLICVVFTISMFFIISGCSKDNNKLMDSPIFYTESDVILVKVKVKDSTFTAEVENSKTTQALISKFPLTIMMTDINNREKYYNFSEDFPNIKDSKPSIINSGEIMIWSKNCLAIFYDTFSNNYNWYVPIGKIENVEKLKEVLGRGDVEVTFTIDK